MLLPKSLLNAQMGGQGFLVAEEGEAAGPWWSRTGGGNDGPTKVRRSVAAADRRAPTRARCGRYV